MWLFGFYHQDINQLSTNGVSGGGVKPIEVITWW
jgi:hypothetical protein